MVEHLTGKVALVIGAGRGVGRHVAIRLAGHGVRVALVARSGGQIAETAGLIAARGGTAIAIPAVVGSPQSVAAMKADVTGQ